jgi:L-rhamnose mutarotase
LFAFLEKHFFFSYFEYVGDGFDANMKKVAMEDKVQRWWKAIDLA